ncbi:MAG: thiamine phosphate synthase [Candidatus Omnitrophica bacterium]|nr:thiamine phosphate synthase [Candidatus Omnitrophota bacterium]
MKKFCLDERNLYLVLDKDICADTKRLPAVSAQAARAGVGLIQFRAKNAAAAEIIGIAYRIKGILSKYGIPLILNDRADIARIVDADGLHLGQDDLPLERAREIIGRGKLIGISCHSINQCLKAQKEGADYISVGPVFKTPTKPAYAPVGLSLIRWAAKNVGIPFFAIGGINSGNLNSVIDSGAERIAVVREICGAKDVSKKVSFLKKRISQ